MRNSLHKHTSLCGAEKIRGGTVYTPVHLLGSKFLDYILRRQSKLHHCCTSSCACIQFIMSPVFCEEDLYLLWGVSFSENFYTSVPTPGLYTAYPRSDL